MGKKVVHQSIKWHCQNKLAELYTYDIVQYMHMPLLYCVLMWVKYRSYWISVVPSTIILKVVSLERIQSVDCPLPMKWFLVNTLKPRQNGRRFADGTFKRIFLNENIRISIKISLKFVPKNPINNNPALVQIMAWRRSGEGLFTDAYMRHSASMS